MEMTIHETITELKKNNNSFVIVNVVKVEGSTPGKTGFKMIVESNGKTYGTVGGGAIENEAVNESQRLMVSGTDNIMREYILNKDEEIEHGDATVVKMTCNGKIWLYYEVEKNLPSIYVFGGGHVGQALINILVNLNYYVILIDNREEIVDKTRAKKIHCIYSDYKEFAEKFIPAEDSFFVSLTYGHQYDYDILKAIYKRNLVKQYIGVIASRSKAAGMINNLKSELGNDIDLSKLHSPIGLKIGGDTAYEIALSIAAEIQAVNYGNRVIIPRGKN
jgi:xanthine dehydrogenase accessory factor